MTEMTYREALQLLYPPFNLTREAYTALRMIHPGLYPPLYRLVEVKVELGEVLQDIKGVKDGAMVKDPMGMISADLADWRKFDGGGEWQRRESVGEGGEEEGGEGGEGGSGGGDG